MKTQKPPILDPWNYARVHPDGSLMLKVSPRNADLNSPEMKEFNEKVGRSWGMLTRQIQQNKLDERFIWPVIDSDYDMILLPIKMTEHEDGKLSFKGNFARHGDDNQFRWLKHVESKKGARA